MRTAIIGAGICGLYLAWKLAEKGEEAVVFEKKEKIGKEACSGLFSDRIADFIPESQKLIQNQINSVLIHRPSSFRENESADEDESKLRRRKFHRPPKKTIKIEFSKKFFVMSHFELDNLIAKLAENAGAKIILSNDATKQDLAALKDSFEKIIGCDGANSQVRKSLGLPEPSYRLAIQGFMPKEDFSNFVEAWPVKSGFIWKIPRGGEIEYGIISNPKEAKKLFNEFSEKNNLNLERINSAVVPQGLIIPQNPKITLCGDAAGLTKPWSGGGVIWGLIAADLLLKNFPDFLKYRNEARKFFLPKIIFSKIAVKMAYLLGFNFPWIIPQKIKIESDFLI